MSWMMTPGLRIRPKIKGATTWYEVAFLRIREGETDTSISLDFLTVNGHYSWGLDATSVEFSWTGNAGRLPGV